MATEADLRLGAAFLKGLPDQAARALEGMDPADAAVCLESFDAVSVAPAVSEMRVGAALASLNQMPVEKARDILAAMEPTAATAVLRLADGTRRDAFLAGLEDREARRLRRVSSYPAAVAGAWCDPTAPAWPGNTMAGELAEAVRRTEGGPQDPLFILHRDGRFSGCVRITDLVSAPADIPVQRLIKDEVTPILDTASVNDAAQHEGWLDFSHLPVIDLRGRFVGSLSRRRLRAASGEAPIARAAGDDLVSGAAAGAASWLGVILEAALSRRSD